MIGEFVAERMAGGASSEEQDRSFQRRSEDDSGGDARWRNDGGKNETKQTKQESKACMKKKLAELQEKLKTANGTEAEHEAAADDEEEESDA